MKEPLTPESAARMLLPWVLEEMEERGITEPKPGAEWDAVILAAAERHAERVRWWIAERDQRTPLAREAFRLTGEAVWREVRAARGSLGKDGC